MLAVDFKYSAGLKLAQADGSEENNMASQMMRMFSLASIQMAGVMKSTILTRQVKATSNLTCFAMPKSYGLDRRFALKKTGK